MDNLKRYFQEHAAEMDLDAPHPETWDRIVERTTTKTIGRRPAKLAIAACLVLLAGVAAWLVVALVVTKKHDEKPIGTTAKPSAITKESETATKEPETATKEPNPATKEPETAPPTQTAAPRIDEHYTVLVNTLIQRLRQTPVYAESPQYFAVFTRELRQMEKDELRIQQDIQTYGPDDALLEQWINLYQQKIVLLKHWQEEIDKMNNKTHGEKIAAWHLDI